MSTPEQRAREQVNDRYSYTVRFVKAARLRQAVLNRVFAGRLVYY
ncbi:MAG: hypothetical protein GFGODING_02541 [Flavobacteriales bacterium]|nr:hypothetical protein [Flavobacteriales bacterium]